MNYLSRYSVSIAASAIISLFSATTAHGQASKVVGQKPSFDDLQSPEFSGGRQKSFKPKDWLEIETSLRISISPEPPSKTCEKVSIKWYVAVKNPDKAGTFLLLTKQVDHVNVPLEDDQIFFSIYLSPSSLKRITGSDKGGKSAVEFVGYEVLINGEKKAEGTNKGQPGWWNAASDKISRSESVPLLAKPETPFANSWWDRYAEVAVERR
ncbi:MAG: Amuc_1102 family pilus-like protein [Luteolibacter sp.]